MKLRQVAMAAETLEPYRTQLFELLGLTDDFADPGVGEFGLENSVMTIGDTYLEIVAPMTENTAAGRTIAKSGHPVCGYMLLFQVDDYESFATHLEDQQLRKIWETEREEVSACHVHPKDIGCAIVSFDEMRPAEEWLWAGPDWQSRRATKAKRILGCDIACHDPGAMATHWAEVLQVNHDDNLRITMHDDTFIQFTQTTSVEGVCGITIETDGTTAVQNTSFGDFMVTFTV